MNRNTIKRVWNLFLVNHLFAGPRAFAQKRRLLRSIGWVIGEDTKIVGPVVCTGHVRIGSRCWIGRDFTVHGNGTVVIGDNCDVAPEVCFFTGGHAIGSPERRAGKGENYTIRIGDGCWLGGRSSFMRSVTVGNGAVVAGCACVTEDVPANTLVGGTPARPIRSL